MNEDNPTRSLTRIANKPSLMGGGAIRASIRRKRTLETRRPALRRAGVPANRGISMLWQTRFSPKTWVSASP